MEAFPQDRAEGATAGENNAIWVHFTQARRSRYDLDSNRSEKTKKTSVYTRKVHITERTIQFSTPS